MRRYETIVILRPSLNEEQINIVIDNTSAVITGDNGKIIELDRWGMKKLAYPIKKEFQGFYVFCDYSGTPEAVAEMERKFRIDDSVLRYMTLKTADTITAEEISEATEKAANKQAQAEEQQSEVVEESAEESQKETPAAETAETE